MKVKSLRFSKKKVSRTKADKPVSVRYTKQDYIQLLGEAEKWPLSLRIAAELNRGGVTLEQFEKEFSLEGYCLNRDVYEHLTNFHLGKGTDPDRVPPVRPVYLRYVPPVRAMEDRRVARATTVVSVCDMLRKILTEGKKHGLKEDAFLKALTIVGDELEPPSAPIKAKSFMDDDENTKVVVKQKPPVFNVLVGKEWKQAASAAAATRLKAQEEAREAAAPVANPTTHCVWCKFPLSGYIVHARDLQSATDECMHFGCYWMNQARQADIPIGLTVLSPAEGNFYVWEGLPSQGKGGWVRKQAKPVSTTHENNTEQGSGVGTDSGTVSSPSGQEAEQAAAVSVAPDTTEKVSSVRKASRGKK